MNRLKLTILAVLALAAAGGATFRLAAQPEPYKPVPTSDVSAYELVLPPGVYQSLVIAYEGGSGGNKTLKATLKAPSGDMTVLVGGGETLVIPLSSAGWTISQPVPIKVTQPTSQVFISAMTPAGPVKIEAAKK